MAQRDRLPESTALAREIARVRERRAILTTEQQLFPSTDVGYRHLKVKLERQAQAAAARNKALLQQFEQACAAVRTSPAAQVQLLTLRQAYLAMVKRAYGPWQQYAQRVLTDADCSHAAAGLPKTFAGAVQAAALFAAQHQSQQQQQSLRSKAQARQQPAAAAPKVAAPEAPSSPLHQQLQLAGPALVQLYNSPQRQQQAPALPTAGVSPTAAAAAAGGGTTGGAAGASPGAGATGVGVGAGAGGSVGGNIRALDLASVRASLDEQLRLLQQLEREQVTAQQEQQEEQAAEEQQQDQQGSLSDASGSAGPHLEQQAPQAAAPQQQQQQQQQRQQQRSRLGRVAQEPAAPAAAPSKEQQHQGTEVHLVEDVADSSQTHSPYMPSSIPHREVEQQQQQQQRPEPPHTEQQQQQQGSAAPQRPPQQGQLEQRTSQLPLQPAPAQQPAPTASAGAAPSDAAGPQRQLRGSTGGAAVTEAGSSLYVELAAQHNASTTAAAEAATAGAAAAAAAAEATTAGAAAAADQESAILPPAPAAAPAGPGGHQGPEPEQLLAVPPPSTHPLPGAPGGSSATELPAAGGDSASSSSMHEPSSTGFDSMESSRLSLPGLGTASQAPAAAGAAAAPRGRVVAAATHADAQPVAQQQLVQQGDVAKRLDAGDEEQEEAAPGPLQGQAVQRDHTGSTGSAPAAAAAAAADISSPASTFSASVHDDPINLPATAVDSPTDPPPPAAAAAAGSLTQAPAEQPTAPSPARPPAPAAASAGRSPAAPPILMPALMGITPWGAPTTPTGAASTPTGGSSSFLSLGPGSSPLGLAAGVIHGGVGGSSWGGGVGGGAGAAAMLSPGSRFSLGESMPGSGRPSLSTESEDPRLSLGGASQASGKRLAPPLSVPPNMSLPRAQQATGPAAAGPSSSGRAGSSSTSRSTAKARVVTLPPGVQPLQQAGSAAAGSVSPQQLVQRVLNAGISEFESSPVEQPARRVVVAATSPVRVAQRPAGNRSQQQQQWRGAHSTAQAAADSDDELLDF